MKHFVISVLLLFFVAQPALAENPARWELKYMDTTIHIFGTIHVLKPGIKWQTKGMLAALDASNNLILEVTPTQLSAKVSYFALKGPGRYRNGDSLDKHLDEDTLKKVFASLRKTGIKPDSAVQYKPWVIEMSLGRSDNEKSTFKRSLGVESILTKRARRNKQVIGGLENATLQYLVLSSLSVDKQIQSLKAALKKISSEEDVKREGLVKAWSMGDMVAIDKYNRENLSDYPGLYKRLLPDRNKNWVEQIHVIVETPGTFFMAVGAGHMPGDEGLINLLKKAGYTVERVE